MDRFKGKRVFVAGAGSGFGRRTAERFAEEGATDIYLVDMLQDRLFQFSIDYLLNLL